MSLQSVISTFTSQLPMNNTILISDLNPDITAQTEQIFQSIPFNQREGIHLERPIYFNPHFPKKDESSLVLIFPSVLDKNLENKF